MRISFTQSVASVVCAVAFMVAAPVNAQCTTGNCGNVSAGGNEGYIGAGTVWDDCGVGGAAYGGGGAMAAGGCGNFFFSLNGLIFNRDNDDNAFLTFQTADGEPLLYSRDAEMDWSGGFDARFGMYFNGGMNALEAVYWGVFPSDQSASALGAGAAGLLNTPLTFDSLAIDPAGANRGVATYFDGAEIHQVTRSYDIHNIEVNLLGLAGFGSGCGGAVFGGAGGCGDGCGSCGSCAVCSSGGCGCGMGGGGAVFTWLMGPRFLRFRENMLFASDLADTAFTGTADELGYNINVENNLLGFQLGGRADFAVGQRLSFYSGLKFGLFGNDMNQHQVIWDGLGNIAEVNDPASPFDGEIYDVSSNKTDVSFLGELDLGLNYRISNCWSANVGYRAVAVSGVALAPSQIPRDYFDNLAGVRDIYSNGSLVLHGAYAGVSFNY